MAINDGMFTSLSHEWQTPPEIFNPLNDEFGFTVDAAATDENALLPRYWTKREDSIKQDWSGERIWCNPPYGRDQQLFVRKAAKLEAEVAVLLIPARTDTRIWHECIFPMAEIRFVKGRIQFVGAPSGAPFPSAVVVWRKNVKQLKVTTVDYGRIKNSSPITNVSFNSNQAQNSMSMR